MSARNDGSVYELDELITLHLVEPELRDVIVEGRADAGFLRWYLREQQLDAMVFAVDDRVEVDADRVRSVNQEVNARGRAITVGVVAHRALGPDQPSLTVIVDADAARVTGPVPIERSAILWTDDAALECYLLRSRPLAKLLDVCLHHDANADEILSAIAPVLGDIWSVRLALHPYGISLVRDFPSLCDFSTNPSSVDVYELVRRSLGGIAKADWPAPIEQLISHAADYRDLIRRANQTGRGHDIAPLLRRVLGDVGNLASAQALEAAIVGCLELVDTNEEQLFRALTARLSERAESGRAATSEA